MESSLGIIDIVVMVASLVVSAAIGLYFTNKNKSIDAYILGDRSLPVIPVAISLMTSCMSGLTLLGASSELYYQGPTYAFIAFAALLSGPITAYTILPVYYHLHEISLYKYLEKRYGLVIKYMVTVIFMFQMIFYNAVVLYVPALSLQAILGVPKLYSILLIGLMGVLYSGVGGLKAVVWTDFFQAGLMYASIIIVGALGTYDAGGFEQVFKNASDGGRLNLDGFFSMDLTTRHTLFGVLLGSTLKHVYLIGVNQVQIQRALSLPSLKQGQLSFLFCSAFTALIILLSSYMGMVTYSTYRSCDPFLAKEIPRRDAVVMHYVAHRLGKVPGLRGMFIAGLFAATLSNLSSFANSMAALTLEDFVRPLNRMFSKKDFSDKCSVWLAKAFATLYGALCVLIAFLIDKANSRLLQATTTMFGAIGVPFLAAFAMGIYTRYTNTLGIMSGLVVTILLGTYITIYQTFVSPPLMPIMQVYYDDRCANIFNMTTISSDQIIKLNSEHKYSDANDLLPARLPFTIDQISYMSLPAVQFVLTFIIASIVSLLTGGWKQQVRDEYLAKMVQRNRIESNFTNTSSNLDLALDRKRKSGSIYKHHEDDV